MCVGVGKTSAAMHTALSLAARTPDFVLVIGVCGAYRTGLEVEGLKVGDLCSLVDDRFADEGVETPEGFIDIETLGFGFCGPFGAHRSTSAKLRTLLEAHTSITEVSGATVSTCSGTDTRADTLRARTEAAVETMEGAAIAAVCSERNVPWVQLRSVSNYTGNRSEAQWDLRGSLARLHEAVRHALSMSD